MRKAAYILVFAMLSTFVIAAPSSMEQRGDQEMEALNYLKAITIYMKAIETSQDEYLYFKLAECYRLSNQIVESSPWYAKCSTLKKEKPEILYYYAQALKAQGKYESAAAAFEEYHSLSGGEGMPSLNKKNLQFMQELENSEPEWTVERLGINSRQADFAPIYFKDGILFTSSRQSFGLLGRKSGIDDMPFTKLFFAPISKKGEIGKAEELDGDIQSRYHEGPATVAKGYKYMYVNRNNFFEGDLGSDTSGITNLKIYEAKLVGGEWEISGEFPFNNDAYSVGHPALSWTGDTLVFVSNMPGGKGGTDLYVTTRPHNGKWREPKNLGAVFNTPGEEMFPFIHRDGSLYFASNGLMGLGGLDVFVCSKTDDGWSMPYNMSAPINSTSDDFGLILDKWKKEGFLSSNRAEGKGSDDIYRIKIADPVFAGCDTLSAVGLCVTLFEENSVGAFMKGIGYEWELGDGTKAYGIEASHCYAEAGTYTVNLNIVDSITNKVMFREATYDLEIFSPGDLSIECPDTVLVQTLVSIKGGAEYVSACNIDEFYISIEGLTNFSKSNELEVTFPSAGNYVVRLLAKGDNPNAPVPCQKCNLKVITVLNDADYAKYKTKHGKPPYVQK